VRVAAPDSRFCLSFLVKIKAVPARTCIAREFDLDLNEQTLNAKGAGLHGWLVRHAGFELL
jgi:hypothetical protein